MLPFWVEANLFIYLCIAFGNQAIKMGGGCQLEIQLTCMTRHMFVLSKIRTWISNFLRRGLFVYIELMWEVIVSFVDIAGIVDHYYLNYLLIT
jgi:hypothetical protein